MLAKLLLSTTILASLTIAPIAHAEDKPNKTISKEVQLGEVRGQIDEASKSLKRDKKALDAHLKQLAKIEKQLQEINRELHERNENLSLLKDKLSGLNSERDQLEEKLAVQQQQLNEQLRAAYMQGKQPAMKVLLNLQNADNLSRIMMYYDYLHKTQLNSINEMKYTLEKLDNNQSAIDEKHQAINKSRTELRRKREQMEAKLKDRQQWIDKIQTKLKSKSLALEKLREDARNLETVIAKQQLKKHNKKTASNVKQNLAPLKGQLNWPVSGDVEHHFGDKIQNKLNWKGIVINGQPGMSVIAPAAGNVVFADWMRGFGLLMIVDHGHGFLSLYGRNQVLYKQPGDSVAPGDVIGLVGTSGGFDKSGLYFELRHHGMPVDPEKWLTKEVV